MPTGTQIPSDPDPGVVDGNPLSDQGPPATASTAWLGPSVEPFTVVTVASPMHDPHALRDLVAPYLAALQAMGGTLGDDRAVATDDPLVVLVLTGGTEARVLDLHRRRKVVDPGEPLVLVTHPAHNALAAGLEAVAAARQLGAAGQVVHLRSGDDRAGLVRLRRVVEDVAVRHRLRSCRIGLVGPPSDWLVASSPGPAVVAETWGPTVVRFDVDEIVRRVPGTVGARSAALAVRAAIGARRVVEPDDLALADAARVEPALRELVETEALDAVAVRCFDIVTRLRTSGCLALAELNDGGVVAGCEGDLTATVAMLWVRELLGLPAWMANPVDVDIELGWLSLAHCTVPRTMVDAYDLRSHFESGVGVGIAGELAADEVTVLRIGGPALDQLWLAEGRVVPSEPVEGRCRTQALIELAPAAVRELLERPLGNHVVLVAGRHAARLRDWWSWLVRPGGPGQLSAQA